MHVGVHRSRGEIPVELFRTELETDDGISFEIDRPVESLRTESGLLQQHPCTIYVACSHDEINILRNHRILSPVVHGNSSDGAPGNSRLLETSHEKRDVVHAACGLPIVELFRVHLSVFSSYG